MSPPLIEVLPNTSKTLTPGWAYVPDTGYDPSKAPLQPAARKRTARVVTAQTSSKAADALTRRLAELDRDNAKDIQIPVSSKAKGKTPNAKKILGTGKTFRNYIEDEEAMMALESGAAGRSKKGDAAVMDVETEDVEDEVQPDSTTPTAAGLTADDVHLLSAPVPTAPSKALMDALCNAPPLSYNAARSGPSQLGRPQRYFCEICGYWGQVKCLQCGTRVCGLDCKKSHDEEKCRRYPV